MVLFPSLCQKHKDIFHWYSPWKPGSAPRGKIHQKCGDPDDWVPWGFLSLRFVHPEPPAIHQLWFCFPYRGTGSQTCALGLCSGKLWVSVFTCWASSAGGRGTSLPCDLASPTDLRGVVDFSVCLAYLVGGQSGDFEFLTCWTYSQKSLAQVFGVYFAYCELSGDFILFHCFSFAELLQIWHTTML